MSILETLIADLTQSRDLTSQVVATIADQHQITEDRLEDFFTVTLPALLSAEDDTAIDLTLSPLFTPTLLDRARYAILLQTESVPEAQLESWIVELTTQGLKAPVKAPSGDIYSLPLSWVSIDRYVKRLCLQQPIHSEVAQRILTTLPESEQPFALALARETVWQGEARTRLLLGFLNAFASRNSYMPDKLHHLTDFVRTYRPANLTDLERQLHSLVASCEADLSKVYGGSFHHPTLKEKYVERGEGVYDEDHDVEAAKTYMRLMDNARALLADCAEAAVPV